MCTSSVSDLNRCRAMRDERCWIFWARTNCRKFMLQRESAWRNMLPVLTGPRQTVYHPRISILLRRSSTSLSPTEAASTAQRLPGRRRSQSHRRRVRLRAPPAPKFLHLLLYLLLHSAPSSPPAGLRQSLPPLPRAQAG